MVSLTRMINPANHHELAIAIKVVLTLAFLSILFLKFDRSKQE